MKIGGISNNSPNASVSSSSAIPYRTGDVVAVQVVRIQNISNALSEMVMRFPNGELLNTSLQGKYIGQEGDVFQLRIQSKTDKQVFAEIVKHQETHSAQKMGITDYLSKLSLPLNNSNYNIVQQMLRNNIPINPESYKQMTDAIKKFKDLTVDQLAFMVKYKLPLDDDTVKLMSKFLEGKNLIGDQLLLLFYDIMDKKDSKKELVDLLKSFFNNPQNELFSAKDLKMGKTISNLISILDNLTKSNSLGSDTLDKVQNFLKKADSDLKFMNFFNSDMVYLQIPINLDGFYGTSELYVQKEHKNNENNLKERSFFLRVPTLNMGIIEIFITLDERKNVQLHFKAEEENEIDVIRKHILNLYNSIKGLDFNISKVSYNELPMGIDIQNFELNAGLISSKKNLDEKV